tara:strand:- start:12229 stop:12762 length:534 start_codon:yes stop_codon:yes gene_type:complete
MQPAVNSSFDVAIWFLDRARSENSYLQPRKLQFLLFFAQGHYAGAYQGRRLMPSVFVVDEAGPLDPNLYRAFEQGRPNVSEVSMDEEILVFLDAIWRRYRDDEPMKLDRLISRYGKNDVAIENRDGSEVGISSMMHMFARDDDKKNKQPKMLRTYTGKAVKAIPWRPPKSITTTSNE